MGRPDTAGRVKFEVVYLEQVCSSCYIKLPYIREVLGRIVSEFPEVELAEVRLTLREEYEAFRSRIKLPIFPVVLLDGEQLTAGTIPLYDQLKAEVYRHLEGGGRRDREHS